MFQKVTLILEPNRISLTKGSDEGPSNLTSGTLDKLLRVKKEQTKNAPSGAVSEGTDTSKSKSLTQDHNYAELLSDGVDPMEPGAFRKLTLMQTSVQLAKDAVDPTKSGQKSNKNAIDLRGYDVHELKRFHTLMLTAISSLKSMAQNASSALSDPTKMLKHVPDMVRSFIEMRDFSALSRYNILYYSIVCL